MAEDDVTPSFAARHFAFAPGTTLDQLPTDGTPGFEGGKKDGHAALDAEAAELTDLQDHLWAAGSTGDRRRVLLVLQGMDTAGKGGIVKHVVGAVHPMGVQYTAFKAPTDAEKRHDFLWRIAPHVPPPGVLGVFDRSHYEDVLIGRVRQLAPQDEIERRYGAITDWEASLADDGVKLVKVMLHISKAEQRERLSDRLDEPTKAWKFNPTDIDERELWDAYQDAYQVMLERTAKPGAPWYVVPGDHKWFARLAVQRLLVEALRSLDLTWPPPDFDVAEQRRRLAAS